MVAEKQETVLSGDAVDLKQYNGVLTAVSPHSGEHRTFRIRTARQGALKGKRIVELLVGPDNCGDYRGFAFMRDNGSVAVWSKHRGTQFEKYAKFLSWVQQYVQQGYDIMYSVCCRRCNRPLTTPESIASGIGPVCAEKGM